MSAQEITLCVSFGKAGTFTDRLHVNPCREQTCTDCSSTHKGNNQRKEKGKRHLESKLIWVVFFPLICQNLGPYGKYEESLKLSISSVILTKEAQAKHNPDIFQMAR